MAKQQAIRAEYSDGSVVISNLRDDFTDETYYVKKVTTLTDGTILTNTIVDSLSPVYDRNDDGEYFAKSTFLKNKVVYLMELGAKGDGISDDTDAIKKGLFLSETLDCALDLGNRTYGYTGKLDIDGKVWVRNGSFKTLTSYKDLLNNSSVFNIHGANATFVNFTLDLNLVNNYGVDVKGTARNILFRDFNVINNKEINGITGISTRSINISDGAEGFTMLGGLVDTVLPHENGISGDTQGAGRGLVVGIVKNTLIDNVGFKNIQGWEDGDVIHVTTDLVGDKWSTTDVTLSNIRIYDIFKSGIKLQASGVKVLSCQIYSDITSSDDYPTSGVRIYGDDNIVKYNIISMRRAKACIIVGAQGVVDNNQVTDNTLINNIDGLTPAIGIRTGHIYLEQPIQNSCFDRNTMIGYGGIEFTVHMKVKDTTFDNCIYQDCKFNGAYTGDSVNGYLQNVSISDSTFRRSLDNTNLTEDIRLQNPDGVTCANNRSFNSLRNYVFLGSIGSGGVKVRQHINANFKGTAKINTTNVTSGLENISYTDSDVLNSGFLAINNQGSSNVETVANLNCDNILSTKLLFSTNLINAPVDVSSGFVLTMTSDLGVAVQFIYRHNLSDFSFVRRRASGAWTAWVRNSLQPATTTVNGTVKQAASVPNIITPTVTTIEEANTQIQFLSTKVNDLLTAMRTAGMIAP